MVMLIRYFNTVRFYNKLPTKTLPVLELFTKSPCSLCDAALEEISPYSDQFHLVKIDISLPENKHWFHRYKYDIPVFHFEGKLLMKHRADIVALKSALVEWN